MYWTGGRVEIEPAQSVLHVKKKREGTSRLSIYRKDGIEY
jgi:hypothetical protein